MHIHTVYFWLREGLSDNEKEQFKNGLRSLFEIKTVVTGRFGASIPSPRDVVDDSFSFSLHLDFETTADHDAYQIDPIHVAFVDNHADKWTRVVVYDSEVMV